MQLFINKHNITFFFTFFLLNTHIKWRVAGENKMVGE